MTRKRKSVTVTLEPSLVEQLHHERDKHSMTVSQIVELAVQLYFQDAKEVDKNELAPEVKNKAMEQALKWVRQVEAAQGLDMAEYTAEELHEILVEREEQEVKNMLEWRKFEAQLRDINNRRAFE